jgi:DNA-binding MarR family transcriptional regulator
MSTKLTYPGRDVSKAALAAVVQEESAGTQAPAYDVIELFFFAYRDFVADPDRVLADYAFGRAHHRVLHFVARRPGLAIAELLELLRITKQSLNRVLKELIDKGFIEQRTGTADRRQRLLYPTSAGRDLAMQLAQIQTMRIRRALTAAGCEDAEQAASRFLLGMIDPEGRGQVHQGTEEDRLAR